MNAFFDHQLTLFGRYCEPRHVDQKHYLSNTDFGNKHLYQVLDENVAQGDYRRTISIFEGTKICKDCSAKISCFRMKTPSVFILINKSLKPCDIAERVSVTLRALKLRSLICQPCFVFFTPIYVIFYSRSTFGFLFPFKKNVPIYPRTFPSISRSVWKHVVILHDQSHKIFFS